MGAIILLLGMFNLFLSGVWFGQILDGNKTRSHKLLFLVNFIFGMYLIIASIGMIKVSN